MSVFLFSKVIVDKLLFKPYKVTAYFGKTVKELHDPHLFKDNCLALGYTILALLTDFLFELCRDDMFGCYEE